MFVPFLSACYTTDTSRLEVPGLVRVQDRVTVLDTLQQLGTHAASSLALKLFDCPTISSQEQALTRQALAGFPHLQQHCWSLLWRLFASPGHPVFGTLESALKLHGHLCGPVYSRLSEIGISTPC